MKSPSRFLVPAFAAVVATATCVALNFGDVTKALTQAGQNPAQPVPPPNANRAVDELGDIGKALKLGDNIDLKTEMQIGESVSLEIIARFGGLVRDRAVSHRVNLLGRTLARYSDRPDLPWRFGVLNTSTVNAVSAPGGYVFITLGLYRQAVSDDALAGVLGHEISHVAHRDALMALKQQNQLAGTDALLTKYWGKYRDAKSKTAVLQQFDISIGNLVKKMVETGFDQATEFTADQGGRSVALTTGYQPGGLRSVLVQLKANGGEQQKAFATHPPLAERIKRLPDEPLPKS